ncbi:MAG: ComEA family DNA-binding protein, partial [Kineosporiaceae bacterium]
PSGTASATVHVAGAVGAPGIVVVAPGARVVDAVAAAGGLADEADVAAINLARPVADGEMILVPVPGQEVPAAAGGGPVPGAPPPGSGAGPSGLVDVNTATAGELEQLPGIGPVLAQRIVAWREDTGPFASVDDLAAVPGIGPATLEELRDSATV